MAIARKCDRCGKFYDTPKCIQSVHVCRTRHPYPDQIIDLCNDCQKKLEDFLGPAIEEQKE